MYKKDMTEKQVAEKNLFVKKLTDAGWDVGGWDELLESGVIDVRPEGAAKYENAEAVLELSYHAEESYLLLTIGTKGATDAIRFRLYFGDRLAEILDAIIERQDTLTRKQYLTLVKGLVDVCEAVLVEMGSDNFVRLTL
jgi:hypothetical protein